MNSFLAIAVMMNNYLHDVATALLIATAVAMRAFGTVLERSGEAPVGPAHRALYRALTRAAAFALAWIIVGGIPRMIFFERLEWWDAAGKGIIPALVVKHVVMFGLVVLGVVSWWRIRRRM